MLFFVFFFRDYIRQNKVWYFSPLFPRNFHQNVNKVAETILRVCNAFHIHNQIILRLKKNKIKMEEVEYNVGSARRLASTYRDEIPLV